MALRNYYSSPSLISPDFPFGRPLSKDPVTAGPNNWFVRSLAVGSGDGRSWLNAFTTLAAAFTAGAAGDKFWVSEDHAETQASAMTLASPGTVASPCYIYCVNHAGSVPPVSADLLTTASIATTGNFSLTLTGSFYYTGIIFNSGSGANATFINCSSGGINQFKNCQLKQVATSASTSAFTFSGQQTELINTTLSFGNTGSRLSLGSANGPFNWRNTASAIAGATIPTQLINNANNIKQATLFGVDLSGLGANTIYTGNGTGSSITLINCKLSASAVVGAITGLASTTDVISSDSTGAIYRQERHRLQGDLTQETTIIRTGGATDGTTPISWKIVTTASSLWITPFESFPITIWNTSTSAITTLTFYGTTTGGGVPNDDQIWVEVEYLGSGSTPLGSFITTTKADNLAVSAATNNSSDSSTWGGSGAGNGFKIVVPSFTPALAGPINITIKAAKISSTYYIDPKPSISGVTVSKSEILAPGVYANELSSGSSGGISRARAASGF